MTDSTTVLPLVHDVLAILSTRLGSSPVRYGRWRCAYTVGSRSGSLVAARISAGIQWLLHLCTWSLALKRCVLRGECGYIRCHHLRYKNKRGKGGSSEKEAVIALYRRADLRVLDIKHASLRLRCSAGCKALF